MKDEEYSGDLVLSDALKTAQEAAEEAGTLQMEKLRSSFEVGRKSTGVDMVTEVDKRCEELITERIGGRYPDHGILGEEQGESFGDSDYLWVIDPLDGTTNYVHGLPIFASSVALLYRGEPLLGVVHMAPLGATYRALRAHGAQKNGRPISVAQRARLGESIVGTGVPYDRANSARNNVDYIAHMAPRVRGLRRLGAAAYDLCLVAEGIYDAYWELKVELWDIAAGILIAEEAGADVRYRKRDEKYDILCSSPAVHEELSRELDSVGPDYEGL